MLNSVGDDAVGSVDFFKRRTVFDRSAFEQTAFDGVASEHTLASHVVYVAPCLSVDQSSLDSFRKRNRFSFNLQQQYKQQV